MSGKLAAKSGGHARESSFKSCTSSAGSGEGRTAGTVDWCSFTCFYDWPCSESFYDWPCSESSPGSPQAVR